MTPPHSRAPFAKWLSDTNGITKMFLSAGQMPGMINLAGGLPDPETWPIAEIATLSARAVLDNPADCLAYSPVEGLPALRDLIASRFSTSGLVLSRDNVLVTTAGMQALDLIGKVLLDPGGIVAAQSPTYLGALDAWKPRYPTYRPMHLETPRFDARVALEGAQFAYTVPNFSNPTGRLVGLEEREALVAAAQASGTWLVEDDPYGALYYDRPRLPRMLTLSATGSSVYAGPVIYMGTLSKELAPGLRIGWIIAAPEMIEALAAAKQGADMCTSGLCQRIACDAIASGMIERVLPVILSRYRARRDALCTAMSKYLADTFEWHAPSGGMFVWATAKDPSLDTDLLLETAFAHGVCVTPSSVFDPEGKNRRSVRINFTLNTPERLEEGIRRLAHAARLTGLEAA